VGVVQGVFFMAEVVFDILFVGLILIPLILNFSSTVVVKLMASYNRVLAKNKNYVIFMPLAVYLIYDLSSKSNWAAQIALAVSFLLFFYIYSCAIAFLVNQASTYIKPIKQD